MTSAMAITEQQHRIPDPDTGPEPEKQRRRRNTAKKRAVLSVLRNSDHFRSAQQLHSEVRQQYSVRVGLTSVYRILHALTDEEVAETQRAENGESLYRARKTTEHRHYLLCRRCGRAVGFTIPALEQQTIHLTQQYHYADVTHYMDVYGICPLCTGES